MRRYVSLAALAFVVPMCLGQAHVTGSSLSDHPETYTWQRSVRIDPMTRRSIVTYSVEDAVAHSSDFGPRIPELTLTCSNSHVETLSYKTDAAIELSDSGSGARIARIGFDFDRDRSRYLRTQIDASRRMVQLPIALVGQMLLHQAITLRFEGTGGEIFADAFPTRGLSGDQFRIDCGAQR